jgi:uncharacterized membrane protein YdjX (TVP38/TMEM64 family)
VESNKAPSKGKVWYIAIFFVAVVVLGLFLYFDRNNVISRTLRSWGSAGIIFAIIMMAIICITPMPSEGLLIMYLKIYGPWWGGLYAWMGAVLSSLVVFVAARHLGKPLLQSLITPKRFEQVDKWVRDKGTPGLLFLRLLPIPGFIVSYIVGTIPSVTLWSFVWTAAVSIIPYYVSSALIYLGVSSHLYTWLGIGGVAFALFWVIGYLFKKKWA